MFALRVNTLLTYATYQDKTNDAGELSMAITISENELLNMDPELLAQLQQYLRAQRGMADSNGSKPPVNQEAKKTDTWKVPGVTNEDLVLSNYNDPSQGHVGVLVEQGGRAYIARRWSLTEPVKDIVKLATKYGFDRLWRSGHPRDEYLFPEGAKSILGSPHIGFSRPNDKRWLFVLCQEAGPPDIKLITFQRTENEEYIKKIFGTGPLDTNEPLRPGQWKRELRGGRNLFVHPDDLEMVLTQIQELKP